MTNKVKCLFGYHKYTIPHENRPHILLCEYCKRSGYTKYSDGTEMWWEYNDKGGYDRTYKNLNGRTIHKSFGRWLLK